MPTSASASWKRPSRTCSTLLEIKNKGMADLRKPAAPRLASPPRAAASCAAPGNGDCPAQRLPRLSHTEATPAPAQTPTTPDRQAPRKQTFARSPARHHPSPLRPDRPPRRRQSPASGSGDGATRLSGRAVGRADADRCAGRARRQAPPRIEVRHRRRWTCASSRRRGYSAAGVQQLWQRDRERANARAANNIARKSIRSRRRRFSSPTDAMRRPRICSRKRLRPFRTRQEVHVQLLQIYANRKDTKDSSR